MSATLDTWGFERIYCSGQAASSWSARPIRAKGIESDQLDQPWYHGGRAADVREFPYEEVIQQPDRSAQEGWSEEPTADDASTILSEAQPRISL